MSPTYSDKMICTDSNSNYVHVYITLNLSAYVTMKSG